MTFWGRCVRESSAKTSRGSTAGSKASKYHNRGKRLTAGPTGYKVASIAVTGRCGLAVYRFRVD